MKLSREKHEDVQGKSIPIQHSSTIVKAIISLQWKIAVTASENASFQLLKV